MPAKKRLALDILRDLRQGEFLEDLTDELHRATTATAVHEGSSSITIKLTIKPEHGHAIVVDKIDCKPAQADAATLFHITSENNLSTRSEKQRDLVDGLEVVRDQSKPRDIDPEQPAQEAS